VFLLLVEGERLFEAGGPVGNSADTAVLDFAGVRPSTERDPGQDKKTQEGQLLTNDRRAAASQRFAVRPVVIRASSVPGSEPYCLLGLDVIRAC